MDNYSTKVGDIGNRPFRGGVQIPGQGRSPVTIDLRRSTGRRSIIATSPKPTRVDKLLAAELKGYPHRATSSSEHGTNTVGGTTQEREKYLTSRTRTDRGYTKAMLIQATRTRRGLAGWRCHCGENRQTATASAPSSSCLQTKREPSAGTSSGPTATQVTGHCALISASAGPRSSIHCGCCGRMER